MIENKILSYDHIVGVHDLIVHDYGPSRRFASAHAEVPANIDIMEAHDVIDLIERDIMNEMGLLISIHMDPIIVDDERINTLRQMTSDIVKEIDPELSIHDFRVVEGPTHTNLIFDILLTHTHKDSHEEIINKINEKLSKIDERFFTVITIDHSFN
jgi:Co/Zn/Cd efflux system component